MYIKKSYVAKIISSESHGFVRGIVCQHFPKNSSEDQKFHKRNKPSLFSRKGLLIHLTESETF